MFEQRIASQILNGNLQDYPYYMAGYYRGLHITIQENVESYFAKISVNSEDDVADDSGNYRIVQFVSDNTSKCPGIKGVHCTSYVIGMMFEKPESIDEVPLMLNQALEPLISFLAYHGYETGCESCGRNDSEVTCRRIYTVAGYYCDACAARQKEEYDNYTNEQQEKVVKKPRKSRWKDYLGALLGVLVGSIIWVLLSKAGAVAGVAGYIVAIFTLRGYNLIGGYIDEKGMAVSMIMMAVAIYFANKIGFAWRMYEIYSVNGVTFQECYSDLYSLLYKVNAMGDYCKMLISGYVFNLLYCIKPIRALSKERKAITE